MKQGSQSENRSRLESRAGHQPEPQAEQSIRESVSALMDGEAEELELRRILSAQHTEVVDDTWRHYQLARELLTDKADAIAFRHVDISQRVSAAIAEQPLVVAKGSSWWIRPAAGFAVAASVAAAVVVGVQDLAQPITGVAPAERVATVASSRVYPLDGVSLQASSGTAPAKVVEYSPQALPGAVAASQQQAEANARKRFDAYLLRHTQQAALNNGQGMISFARVASFDTDSE